MSLSVKNWNRPTPAKWRNTGDALLFAIPLLTLTISQSPLPEGAKAWATFISNLLLVIGKFVTKFFGEPNTQPTNEEGPVNV